MKPTPPGDHALHRKLEATMRALTRQPRLSMRFGNVSETAFDETRRQVTLPAFDDASSRERQKLARGMADSAAFFIRYHDPLLHQKRRPASPGFGLIFDALEEARVETLGAERFRGVRGNVTSKLRARLDALSAQDSAEDATLAQLLGLMLRDQVLREAETPLPKILADWRKALSMLVGDWIGKLAQARIDQGKFASLVQDLIDALRQNAKASSKEPEDAAGNAVASSAEPANEADGDASETGQPETKEENAAEAENPDDLLESAPAQAASFEQGGETDAALPKTSEVEAALPSALSNTARFDLPTHYHAFVTRFDETVRAETLVSAEEMQRLRMLLDQKLVHLQSITRTLAQRLQHVLLARESYGFDYHQEEGLIDGRQLSRLIATPGYPFLYKREKQSDHRNTIVSLLLDNSGSMRGRPITVAALCADILARTLEHCGVRVEILGFTTRDWKGGQSRKAWMEAGRPLQPGRLNDLRHIIYKSADTRWQKARRNLGLMLKDGVLKENIDGEALLWAHQRLLARPERRRILMIISDGAPVDDSTLSVNPGNYLDQHLRDAIQMIEERSNVELLAIGIGHDVARYYARAVTIRDVSQLGEAIGGEMVRLFKRK
jgi:cobaltochelatase CobT